MLRKYTMFLVLIWAALAACVFVNPANATWQDEDAYLAQLALYRPGGQLTIDDYYLVFPYYYGYEVKPFKQNEGSHLWVVTNLSAPKFKRVYSDKWVVANRWHYNDSV